VVLGAVVVWIFDGETDRLREQIRQHHVGEQAGRRARTHLDPYLRWAQQHNSLLIVTFDEDDNAPDSHIATLAAGATVHPGHYGEPVTDYRVLSTVERLLGLSQLNKAAPMTDIFGA
jgi:acid phosphatase